MILTQEMLSHTKSLYSFDVSSKLGKEYVILCEDIARMLLIQITIQLMFYLSNPSEMSFITSEFILLLLYIVLGVCVYWLVFKNLIQFK